ncbi:two-component sensor histidine kinase [Paenibacillus helianthi]|uniref:histidine kinase n=1 Tax=Paenibacillus helianthi TaxID=1349432 RepID=A0ABX3EMW2_9BACL|nr:HAMP domain-containing sensor histidine kinase [Paenibacillus helianthi]OKP83954.1 two-component sensor histidine kinase [Paenibacillus helianthi]
MTESVRKPRQKKRIQTNILIRMVLSLIITSSINISLSILIIHLGNVTQWGWVLNVLSFLLTPLFLVIFVFTFFTLTRGIVRDLISLEQGLQIIAEGNLDYRVSVAREDELGRVALNINRMAERLEQQIVKEREVEKSKMEMITGISHDLRTPLTSIIGYIELLRTESYQDQEEYTRFIQNTYNKAIHLKKLLDDLFEYTRLTSVDSRLILERSDLSQLLNQLLFEFEPIAQENNVHLVKDITNSPIITLIDSEKIARAIDNLLMNALKYSLKPGSICIRMITEPQQCIIEVENKGTPLSKDQEKRLFERFYKVDHSRKSEGIQTGAGLGLSIARNIAELHKGTLSLEHSHDIFTFRLRLPFQEVQEIKSEKYP